MVSHTTDAAVIYALINSIKQPLVIFRRLHVIATNTAFATWLGYLSVADVPRRIQDLVAEESYKTAISLYLGLNQPNDKQIHFLNSHGQSISATADISRIDLQASNTMMATIKPLTEQFENVSLDNLPIGIYRRDVEGNLLYANKMLANIFGFETVAELRKHNLKSFVTEETPSGHYPSQDSYHRGYDEYIMQGADERRIWVRDIGQTITDKAGNILYTYGSIEDITTQRMQTEELHKHNSQLEILNLISAQLSSTNSLETILTKILKAAQAIIPYVSASVFIAEKQYLIPAATVGIPDGVELSQLKVPIEKSLLKMSPQDDGTIERIPDVNEVDTWIPLQGMEFVRSWIGVPVWYNNTVIGTLNFDHSEANFFTREHEQFALNLARQIAVVFNDAKLYEQAQNELQERLETNDMLINSLIQKQTLYWILDNLVRANELNDAILHDTLNMLIATQENTTLVLILFDKDNQSMLHHLQLGEAELNGWELFCDLLNIDRLPYGAMPLKPITWENGITTIWRDGHHVYAAPIDQYGMLAAVRESDGAQWDENDSELMQTIANQLTIVVQKQLLSAELQRNNAQLEQMVEARTQAYNLERQRVEAILDATAEGIFYMEDYRLQYANPAFLRMVGYTSEELLGKPLSFVLSNRDKDDDDNATNLFRALTSDGGSLRFDSSRDETRLQHKDGTEFYAAIRYSILGELDEETRRLVGIARDISQERELYFQRSQFITNAAHELRNPLSSLGLRIHLIRRNPNKIQDSLESLQAMYERLVSLVEELADLSRFEEGRISLDRDRHNLRDIMTQAMNEQATFAEQQGINVTIDMGEQNIPIHGDGRRLLQLLNTLIINGVNYNEPNGHVHVEVSIAKDTFGEDAALIWVKDDGLGVSRDLLPSRIFEPFSRYSQGTRKETGMGLALAREIVRLHGGTIHAQSEGEGMGTTLRVMLPLHLKALNV